MKNKDITTKEEILAIGHILLAFLAVTSPFWLDWKIVFLGLALYGLQLVTFKGCILTNIQFKGGITKKTDGSIYTFWAEKLGFKPNRKKLNFVVDYLMTPAVLIITIIWQLILHMPILLRI